MRNCLRDNHRCLDRYFRLACHGSDSTTISSRCRRLLYLLQGVSQEEAARQKGAVAHQASSIARSGDPRPVYQQARAYSIFQPQPTNDGSIFTAEKYTKGTWSKTVPKITHILSLYNGRCEERARLQLAGDSKIIHKEMLIGDYVNTDLIEHFPGRRSFDACYQLSQN